MSSDQRNIYIKEGVLQRPLYQCPINSSNNTFRYETSDGDCYEGTLSSTTEPNIFVKVN